ncbi:MAG: phospho-N-acetylmuramoyl-pentapeptide-transferase [Synergistaceae bacterium]|jgi:phospho-N-acetylmuramoyl-pentapeptide-transferase|nr:phospho-N-acetylmuramoyl-pentapeptide-transferase [Synergistaceae bacterium]
MSETAVDMRYAIIAGVLSFGGGTALQRLLIFLQRRLRVAQVQKSYGVGIDVEVKSATPTMGGVAFAVSALVALGLGFDADALLFWGLPIACAIIGFVDDWLKVSNRSSEGFTSLRKLTIQVITAFFWVVWALLQKGLVLWPGFACPFWLAVPVTVLAAVGMMNAVNVTDGLDGLAGGTFMISLGVLGYLLTCSSFLSVAFAVLLGVTASFLLYNVRPARIFMGDAGSHFLGGALVALCVQGGAIGALIPAGFLFGIELLSSAVQIIAIRKFNKKIFRMAPLHHHFQRLGWDETTVTSRFLVVHAVGAAFLAALCVQILGL